MSGKRLGIIIGIGAVNYAIRFAVGGLLFMGLQLNPEGIAFGSVVTLTAFIAAYILLRYAVKSASRGEALGIAAVWMLIALVLDAITAQPIVGVTAGYLFSEPQVWTRLFAIIAAALLVRPRRPVPTPAAQ